MILTKDLKTSEKSFSDIVTTISEVYTKSVFDINEYIKFFEENENNLK